MNPRRILLPVAGLLAVAGILSSCGDRPRIPHAGPLLPEYYAIAADDRPAPGQFMRYAAPGPGPGGLDIAVTDYESPEGKPPVRLVGVVHIADAPYYEAIQRELDTCETVLYEAVKSDDVSMADWTRGQAKARGELAGFQHEVAGWLGLRWQLESIDYSSPRFVHADMTLDEFLAAGGAKLLPDLPVDGESSEGKELPAGVRDLIAQLRTFGQQTMSDDNPMRSIARRGFAEALGTQDLSKALDMFPAMSDLILVKRNEVAMEKLEAALPKATRGPVCLFYGAAHMKGMEKELTGRLGYARKDGRWYRAWALRPPLS